MSSMKRLLLAALLTFAACGEDLTVTPVRNLERPSDMDFVCMAETMVDGAQVVTGTSMSACYEARESNPQDAGQGSRLAGTTAFALFTNTARSEVGAINMLPPNAGGDRLVDLDREQPAFNMLPVGSLPERLVASDDGCRTVTANRGSCDLSLIDNSRLFARQFQIRSVTDLPSPGAVVRRVSVRTEDGRTLSAVPGEVAILPGALQPPQAPPPPARPPGAADAGADGAGDDGGVLDGGAPDAPADAPPAGAVAEDAGGEAAGEVADPQPGVVTACTADPPAEVLGAYRAVVTFPGCDLVALVDLNSGRILSSMRMRADGSMEDAGRNPTCPAECTGGGPPAADASAPAPGDGGAAAPGPLGLSALALHPEAGLVYVGANRSPVIATLGVTSTSLQLRPEPPITLAENPGGVTRIRLSRDPYRKFGGQSFVGPYGPFLYAFAQDGSVRVVRLNGRFECDVTSPPVSQGAGQEIGCIPVGTGPRSLLARGPGLRPPLAQPFTDPDVGPALPVDIAFTQMDTVGIGFMIASNGVVYQVGLGGQGAERPHLVRPERTPAPTAASAPTRSFGEAPVPFPTRVSFNTNDTGPNLQQSQAKADQYLVFRLTEQVPSSRSNEGAVLRWQGILPGVSRPSGNLEAGGTALRGSVAALVDEGADFCRSGVEPGDLLSRYGCEEDRDCEALYNHVCYRATPGAQGACIPRNLAADESWGRRCQAELGSRRRYEVLEVSRTRVVLGLKPDEVPRPAIAPCNPLTVNDAVCQPDAAHRPTPNVPNDRGFQCVELAPGRPRCLKPCGVPDGAGGWLPNDDLCRSGHVCADMGNPAVGPVCVEGPAPSAECTPGEARYQIQVGNGYLVTSGGLPYFSRVREAGGRCEPDPNLHPLKTSRLSLDAPACTSFEPKGGLSPSEALDLVADPARPEAGPCLFTPRDRADSVSAVFENPHFRLVLNNIDQYVGDAALIATTIEDGYEPVTVFAPRETPSLAVRIITGPLKARTRTPPTDETKPPAPYIFVVDQGRTTSLLSRGKIMRIYPYPHLYPPGGHFDSILTGSLYPIQ